MGEWEGGEVVRGQRGGYGEGGFEGVGGGADGACGGEEGWGDWGGGGGKLAGVVGGDESEGCGGELAREISFMALGEIAEFGGGTVGGGDWGKRSCGNCAGEKGGEGGCGEKNSALGEAWGGVGSVDLDYGEGGGGGGLGIGEEQMKTVEELVELIRQAVAETLRKKDGVLDGQRLGADLGAESIDRIDLTFRLEEAVGKALDEKILFAEPDPTLAELAARLAKMIEEKK